MVSKLGLIGSPVGHSLSPVLFELLGRRLRRGLDYQAIEVKPGELGDTLRRLRGEGYMGLNVTIPHKESVIPYLDSLSAEARAIGAVNVIRLARDSVLGHNTDAAGFRDTLEEAGFEARGKDALIFGSGGGARAVGYALGRAGAREVRFVARKPEKAGRLVKELEGLFPKTNFFAGRPRPASILINATPLGMNGFPQMSPAPEGLSCDMAFDLVYGKRTPFLAQALALGARTADGLGMLVFQALRSWEFWFGPMEPGRRKDVQRDILKKLRKDL